MPHGGGSFSSASCRRHTTCRDDWSSVVCSSEVSYTPAVVGAHTITGSYSGDGTHLSSAGTFEVTALKHATSTVVNCTPDTAAARTPNSHSPTDTVSTLLSATAQGGTVSWGPTS